MRAGGSEAEVGRISEAKRMAQRITAATLRRGLRCIEQE